MSSNILVISPIDIATLGFLYDPLAIATDGLIILVKEEIIVDSDILRKIPTYRRNVKKNKEKVYKKITVTLTVDGVEYTKTKITKNVNIKLSDIRVVYIDKKIKIYIMK